MMVNGASNNQGGIWQHLLSADIGGPDCERVFGVQAGTGPQGELAHGNHTVAELKAKIDADLTGSQGTATKILLNVGVKEMSTGMPLEAAFESDLSYIVDAMHTKWPGATLYIMTPWRRGYPAEVALVAGYIDVVQSTRAWLLNGPDERVWMEGGDDGATMTHDGLHYGAAGVAQCSAQWKTVLGY